MISTENTLEGSGLSVHELIERLTNNLTIDFVEPDILQRELQKNLINHFKILIEDDKLSNEVKGFIQNKNKYLLKYFKSKRKSKSQIHKIHYQYCYNLLK